VLSHFSRVWLSVILWTVAHQVPLSMRFSMQEYWSGWQCPSPGDLSDPVIEPTSLTYPALAGGFFTISATWEAHLWSVQFSHSVVSNSAIPWTAACQASLSITNSWSLLKLVHWVSNARQPCNPLSSPSPPAIYDNSQQNKYRGNVPHHYKGHIWQAHS